MFKINNEIVKVSPFFMITTLSYKLVYVCFHDFMSSESSIWYNDMEKPVYLQNLIEEVQSKHWWDRWIDCFPKSYNTTTQSPEGVQPMSVGENSFQMIGLKEKKSQRSGKPDCDVVRRNKKRQTIEHRQSQIIVQ